MSEKGHPIEDSEKSIGLDDIEADLISSQAGNIQEIAAEVEGEKLYTPNVRMDNAKAAAAEEYVEVLKQDREERAKYAGKLFRLICAWLASVYLILLCNGIEYEEVYFKEKSSLETEVVYKLDFNLSEPVLLALIGGTTINVLGLFVIVANYLFNSPQPPDKQ